MTSRDWRERQSLQLLRFGMTWILVALVAGLVLPWFRVPRLGLSVHLLGLMQGMLLAVLGLIWPRLRLAASWSRAAAWLAVYGCVAAWTANVLAAAWGGSAMLPIASGQARSSPVHDGIITLGLRSGAVALVSATVLVSWGLWRDTAE